MPIRPGETLAHYEIGELLGKGGMGEVYRARDQKLERDVAIKVLPAELTDDPERVARFEREAKLLAALNHSGIAAIYGFDQIESAAGTTRFLALEFVDGTTLADRLRGGPLAVDETLEVCRQIAEALEAAHAHGIVHRDLKPGNVMLRSDGTVKVLDLGLARAVSEDPASGTSAQSSSPTITADHTQPGVVLGTAPYMSPEQARGRPVDKRTDIWAFGCVLYECLTGVMLFGGESVSDSLGAILHKEPDWQQLPADTPPTVRLVLRRCLTKDRERRLHDLGDARVELDDALRDPASSSLGWSPDAPARARRASAPWLIALVLIVLVTLGVRELTRPGAAAPAVQRLSIVLPQRVSATTNFTSWMAAAPDGSAIAYVARTPGRTVQLLLRRLDQSEPQVLLESEHCGTPVFSPDGQWILFGGDQQLRKVSVRGGPTAAICESSYTFGATWGSDGNIVFAGWKDPRLFRVSADGGPVETLLTLPDEAGEPWYPRWPHMLADGSAVLFGTYASGSSGSIEAYSLRTGARHHVIDQANYPIVTGTGHLVFVRGATIMAAPFDASSLKVTGPAVPLVEGLRPVPGPGWVEVALSDTGALFYVAGSTKSDRGLFLLDPNGASTPGPAGVDELGTQVSLARDGRLLAATVGDGIHVVDLEKGIWTPVTTEDGDEEDPCLSADGQWLYYRAREPGSGADRGVFRRRIDGAGAPECIYRTQTGCGPTDVAADGRLVLATEWPAAGQSDIVVIDPTTATARSWLASPSTETDAKLSPDGRWVAYRSDESGEPRVYVRPFEGDGGRVPVSPDLSGEPRWSDDGSRLYYFSTAQNAILAVEVTAGADGGSFTCTPPEKVVDLPLHASASFGVFSGGERFAVVAPATPTTDDPAEIRVVLNFAEVLRRATGPK